MKRDLRKKFLVIWVFLLVTWGSWFLFLLLIGQIDLTNSPDFEDISLCSKNNGSSIQTNKLTFQEGEDIILCGKVKTTVPTDLSIVLFIGSNQNPVYNEGIHQIANGSFSYKLSLGQIPEGQYRVEVYYERELIADLGFKINP